MSIFDNYSYDPEGNGRQRLGDQTVTPPPDAPTRSDRPLGPLLQDYLPSMDKIIGNPVLNGGSTNARIDPTVMTPRTDYVPPQASPTPSYSPLATAVSGAPGVTRQGSEYSGTGTAPPDTRQIDYAYTQAQDARGRQDQQQGTNAMLNGGRVAQSSFDLANAQQAARVSRFRATDGADMVLAPENSGYDAQRAAIVGAAKEDQAKVKDLTGQLNTDENALAGNRNYIDEYAKSQQEINRAELTKQTGSNTSVEVAGKQLDVANKKRLDALGDALTKAKSPEEARTIQTQILTMLGKGKDDRFTVIHAPIKTTDPRTLAVTETPQFVLYDKESGKAEVLNMGGAAQPAAKLSREEAEAGAKKALAAGVPADQVMKAMKDMGY